MPSIKLLKRAEIELIDASQWYENKQVGLSKPFRSAIANSLNSISNDPLIFSKRFNNDFRYAFVHKFPYVVFYWYDEVLDTVFVTSIFHTKRDSKKFKSNG